MLGFDLVLGRLISSGQARGEARRIRDAAASVFAERGYTGASTAEICRAAGVGSGTLFHDFGDKRSIIPAIFAEDQLT